MFSNSFKILTFPVEIKLSELKWFANSRSVDIGLRTYEHMGLNFKNSGQKLDSPTYFLVSLYTASLHR